jgi:hypothetical protein
MGFSKSPNGYNWCEFFDNARQKTQVLSCDKHKFFYAAVPKKAQ